MAACISMTALFRWKLSEIGLHCSVCFPTQRCFLYLQRGTGLVDPADPAGHLPLNPCIPEHKSPGLSHRDVILLEATPACCTLSRLSLSLYLCQFQQNTSACVSFCASPLCNASFAGMKGRQLGLVHLMPLYTNCISSRRLLRCCRSGLHARCCDLQAEQCLRCLGQSSASCS